MNGKPKSVWYLLGLLPAAWLGLLVAPAASGGLFEIIRQFPAAMQHPFHIIWCEDSGKAVLFFVAAYGLLVGAMLSTRRSYRRGVEHGSAKWGSPERLNRKYCAKPPEPNKVFTQHIRMGLDGRKHRRNLNTVVVGGSGAGKTRCYAKPCLYEACLSPKGPSFVCLDPKGELLRDSGGLLRESADSGHSEHLDRSLQGAGQRGLFPGDQEGQGHRLSAAPGRRRGRRIPSHRPLRAQLLKQVR